MNAGQSLEDLLGSVHRGVVFSQRPDAIPGDLRLSWRLPMLCMLLRKFWGSSTSLECLHTVWWAVRTRETRDLFLRWYQGLKRPDEVLVRFDPSLTLTLDLAIGEGLVVVSESRAIVLTADGQRLAEQTWQQKDAFTEEKAFLGTLPTLSQRLLKELTQW